MIRVYFWAEDRPIAQMDTELTYLHADHLDTPRIGTNSNGTIVWQWNSDAFGSLLPNEDPDGNGMPTTVNLRFPGQYFDQETNLHYNYFRDYDPRIGRYLESDPIGLEGGANLYLYANAAPLVYTDPLGLNPLSGAITGAGVGSTFGPIGTVVGGLAGAGFGAWIGSDLVRPIFSEGNEGDPVVYPDNPDKNRNRFRNIPGTRGKQCDDGSVWERDTSKHGGDQWKRWPDKQSWEKGKQPTSIWPDGRIRK